MAPLSFGLARQPDSDWLRLWETTARRTRTRTPSERSRPGRSASTGGSTRVPHRFLAQAALHALHRWVGEGTPPPRAARIELASQQPLVIARDRYRHRTRRRAHASGGRAGCHAQRPGPAGHGRPWLAGAGSTTPLDDATLLRLHGDKSGYRTRPTPLARRDDQGRLPAARGPGGASRPGNGLPLPGPSQPVTRTAPARFEPGRRARPYPAARSGTRLTVIGQATCAASPASGAGSGREFFL